MHVRQRVLKELAYRFRIIPKVLPLLRAVLLFDNDCAVRACRLSAGPGAEQVPASPWVLGQIEEVEIVVSRLPPFASRKRLDRLQSEIELCRVGVADVLELTSAALVARARRVRQRIEVDAAIAS
jgi:hypothetical protein